jgi:hypothetical protein
MDAQSDHNSLLQSWEGNEDSEVSNHGEASSAKHGTDNSYLDYFHFAEHSPEKHPYQDKLMSASQASGVASPPSLEHYEAHIKEKSADFSGQGNTKNGRSKTGKRALSDKETQRPKSKIPRIALYRPSQPLEHTTRSQREQTLHYYQTAGLANGTYKREQYTKRNQNVLGLKYTYNRHGNPRRPVLYVDKPPDYIDRVVGYHNYSIATKGPPPGLETLRGQFAPSEVTAKSTFPQFQHDRLHHYTVKQSSHGGNGRRKDTAVQCGNG